MKTAEEILMDDVLAACSVNIRVCARTLFPDLFYSPFSILHEEIFKLIDSGHRKIAIAAPRGIGKTTIARTVASRGILFRDIHFITYVSNSATSATLQTENIKRELISNKDIRELFGSIKENDFELEMDESFSKESWVAFGNTLVMPRGAGQQVRGLLWKNYRPQLIIVDDLEKKDELLNPDNREALKDWFHSDLEKSINRYADDWRIIYIDTLKHQDSLLQELINSSDWKSIVLSICDDNYHSNAPDYMNDEEIKEELQSHREKGKLDIFYMEYMNAPTSKEDASFKEENFKHYNETDKDKQDIIHRCENVIICDPAKTVKLSSADSAIVGIGLSYDPPGIYFRDCKSGKMYPDELYKEFFDMAVRLRAFNTGVEVTGIEEFIKQPIENYRIEKGIKLPTPIWLRAKSGPVEGMKADAGTKGKLLRIAALIPYYRMGYIWHNNSCCAQLESQLLAFPRAARLDVMDAFAYIIEMMDLGSRYFSPPDETSDDIEAEYKDLDNEPPLTEWRLI